MVTQGKIQEGALRVLVDNLRVVLANIYANQDKLMKVNAEFDSAIGVDTLAGLCDEISRAINGMERKDLFLHDKIKAAVVVLKHVFDYFPATLKAVVFKGYKAGPKSETGSYSHDYDVEEFCKKIEPVILEFA